MGSSDMDNSLIIEERSKKFLKDIMGKDTYNRFIQNGKIEIKSGKSVYELTTHGTVTNKTTNQSYCVILAPGTPDRDYIPLFDIIAIKYAWLKYEVNIVEKVANKRNLDYDRYIVDRLIQRQTVPPLEYDRGYAGFVRHMETVGWRREQLTLDESNTSMVAMYDVGKNTRDYAIVVRAPAGRIITMMGMERISEDAFIHADRLGVRLANKDGKEIPLDTDIEIVKNKIGGYNILYKPKYSNININITKNSLYTAFPKRTSEWFAFQDNVVVNSEQSLGIRLIDPECDIDKRYTRLSIDLDLWIRDCSAPICNFTV